MNATLVLTLLSTSFTPKVFSYLDKLWTSQFQKCRISLCSACTGHERLPSPRWSVQKNPLRGTNTQLLEAILVCHWQHYSFHKLLNLHQTRTLYHYLQCLQRNKFTTILLPEPSVLQSKYLFLESSDVIIILSRLFIYFHSLHP